MRRLIICVTFAIVAGMCLYPPWSRTAINDYTVHVQFGDRYVEMKQSLQAHYAFFLDAPDKFREEDETLMITSSERHRWPKWYLHEDEWIIVASIDIPQLLVQCGAVLFAGGGLAVLCRKGQSIKGAFICSASCVRSSVMWLFSLQEKRRKSSVE